MTRLNFTDLMDAGQDLMQRKLNGEIIEDHFPDQSPEEITYGTDSEFQRLVPHLLKAGAKHMQSIIQENQ